MLCWFLSAVMLVLTVGFMNGEALGITVMEGSAELGYESLFDDTVIHTIDIVADESAWADMLDNAQAEEYIVCNVVIDGEAVKNAAVRAKGNTSLSQVSTDRYSLKIEFDHYEAGNSYRGLDKLVINNLIQDDTYLKDWLCYTLFREMGVAAPLTSFAVVTVNGEYYGLCLALEAVEESFLQRNYGDTNGDLYKPDSAMGGDGSANLCYNGDSASAYSDIFDSAKTDVTSGEQAELIAALKALSEGDVDGSVDMDALMRYFVVHNFVVNGDSYTGMMIHNYYLYQDDGKLSMLPWDYNLAFGAFSMGGGMSGSSATSAINWPLDDPLLSGSMSTRPMLAWIFESEEYTQQYHALMDEFIEKCFESGWFAQRMEQIIALLTPYVQQDRTSFTGYDSFAQAAATLTQFCELRAQSLRGQLDGSIPSTSAGQSADSSALIDAGDLAISTMGGMGMGGMNFGGMDFGGSRGDRTENMEQDRISNTSSSGGDQSGEDNQSGESAQGGMTMPSGNMPQWNGQMPSGDGQMPQWGGQMPQGGTGSDGTQMPEGMEIPEDFQSMDFSQFAGNFGDRGGMMGGGSFSGGVGIMNWVMTGAATLTLLAALLFVRKYKRR